LQKLAGLATFLGTIAEIFVASSFRVPKEEEDDPGNVFHPHGPDRDSGLAAPLNM
jgi:hypothetical protein